MTPQEKHFRDSWLLVERAKRDREALDAKIEAFIQSTPGTAIVKADPKDPLRFHVSPKFAKKPDPDLEIDFGLIGMHLRSALDYIPAQLANPDDPSKSGTQFPIYSKESKYLQKGRGGRTARERHLDGVPQERWTLFDQQQPYERGDDPKSGPLKLLTGITNAHKHRELHAFAVAPHGGAVWVIPTGQEPFTHMIRRGDMLKSETDLFSFRLPAHVKGNVQVNCNFAMAVGFGRRPFEVDQLGDIFERISEILSAFEAEIV
ncbi:MAG TPA: hypothetical protein VIS51_02755 [Solirubrobacterales bacterium]